MSTYLMVIYQTSPGDRRSYTLSSLNFGDVCDLVTPLSQIEFSELLGVARVDAETHCMVDWLSDADVRTLKTRVALLKARKSNGGA